MIAGDGPAARRLRAMAPPNVRFAGRVDDAQAAELLTGCRAFVLTAVEEFGIAAVEAQAAGRPVIARRGGGVLETVVNGVTGTLWDGTADELADAVRTSTRARSILVTACTTRCASIARCSAVHCRPRCSWPSRSRSAAWRTGSASSG